MSSDINFADIALLKVTFPLSWDTSVEVVSTTCSLLGLDPPTLLREVVPLRAGVPLLTPDLNVTTGSPGEVESRRFRPGTVYLAGKGISLETTGVNE